MRIFGRLCLIYLITIVMGCSTSGDPTDTSTVPDGDECVADSDCSDDNICTIDLCTKEGCQNISAPFVCDDGDPCTVGDSCQNGACTSGVDVCECRTSADCDDGDMCNGTESCKTDVIPHRCVTGTPITCPSNAPCNIGICDPETGGCGSTPADDGSPCDDSDSCTIDDTCQAGLCSGGLNICECQEDIDCQDESICNGTEQCDTLSIPHKCISGLPVLCTESQPCQISECSETTGLCEPTNKPDGVACDNGNVCTAGDTCLAGICTAGISICECTADSDCDDGDPCTGVEYCNTRTAPYVCVLGEPTVCESDVPCIDAVCDPASGQCIEVDAANGLGCDDQDPCTVGDICTDGSCSGFNICEGCLANTDCNSGVCLDGICFESGDACGDFPPDGQCVDGHFLVCADGALDVTECADECGGCVGCIPECKYTTTGCSGLNTHAWTCVLQNDCPVREYSLCELGCVEGYGCKELIDTDNDQVPDVEDQDDDGDAVPDIDDVCPLVPDDQTDTDSDGLGNACDDDDDDDFIPDTLDNCPIDANTDQLDSDGDLIGDACETYDDDEDGFLNSEDNCPDTPNPEQTDTDDDTVGDACDNCPSTPNPEQLDTDTDTVGNACDNCPNIPNLEQLDGDSDSIGDLCDNCLNTPNDTQLDTDEDTVGDSCDNCLNVPNADQSDQDVDTIGDVCDNCPGISNTGQADSDADTIGDACDNCLNTPNLEQADADIDTVGDVCDNCLTISNLDQVDSDQNGAGDACDPVVDVNLPPEITTVGTADAIRLQGVILTTTGAIAGEVLTVGDTIACVSTSCADHAQAAGAWVVNTHGIISPGLIDTHNHILFDIFNNDDWVPTLPSTCATTSDCIAASDYCKNGACACVDGVCRYTNHNDWPKEAEYGLMLDYKQCLEDASQGKPDWCPTQLDEDGSVKCEMQKWGELKGLISGTTSIVGLPGTSGKCVGSVARSIDVSQNDLDQDKIQTSALFPPSSSSANGVCNNYADGDTEAYLIHVGEGVDQSALNEFTTLFTVTTNDGCLYSSKTAITHGTAFGQPQFATMAEFDMKLIWSPASNLALYGATTDIPTALGEGLTVALAPDWSMGGSQNLLDELRVANTWDEAQWGNILSPIDLFAMVTENAATALSLENVIGTIEVGYMADLVVFSPNGGSAFDAVLDADPTNVRLVMIGGVPLYGHPNVAGLAPQDPACETINICGSDRFLCIAEPTTEDKLNQTSADIQLALSDALIAVDSLVPVDNSVCGGCPNDEECYLYGAKPVADPSLCPEVCAAGTTCIRAKKSGSNQYQCLPTHTCSPVKSNKQFAPLAPLYACPPAAD